MSSSSVLVYDLLMPISQKSKDKIIEKSKTVDKNFVIRWCYTSDNVVN